MSAERCGGGELAGGRKREHKTAGGDIGLQCVFEREAGAGTEAPGDVKISVGTERCTVHGSVTEVGSVGQLVLGRTDGCGKHIAGVLDGPERWERRTERVHCVGEVRRGCAGNEQSAVCGSLQAIDGESREICREKYPLPIGRKLGDEGVAGIDVG